MREGAAARREAIVALVGTGRITSQFDLGRHLAARGYPVNQATLSRDLQALGIGKRPATGGAVYALPAPARDLLDRDRQRLELEAFVHDVRVVGNLVLVHTPPGNAPAVARAIDLLEWTEVAGTLAGDDTILVIAANPGQARRFRKRLRTLAGREAR